MTAISAEDEGLSIGSRAQAQPGRRDLAVTVWLWTLAACVLAMVIVGGATRLTESGLSITQWKPIEGIIPPLSKADWLRAFAAYRATPQFLHLFPDMTLTQFKHIFMWEWSHRLLGRVVGLVVALPLAWFWWTGRISRALGLGLLGVFVLGGFQGLLGWLMVKSGLTGRVEVAPEMLAAHLLMASILLILLVSLAVGVPRGEAGLKPRLRRTATILPFLILFQIGLGALVAGTRAGYDYNTWPLMDGGFAPALRYLTSLKPVWLNAFENVALVQLDHRLMAYVVVAVTVFHAADALWTAPGSRLARRAVWLALFVLAQAGIGIMTLLLVVPLWAGLLHQLFAMTVLMKATAHWRRSAAGAREAPSLEEAAEPDLERGRPALT